MNESQDHIMLSPTKIAWQKFKQNKFGLAALIFIFMVFIIAVLGANIRPDQTKHANSIELSLAQLKPLTTVKFLRLGENKEASETNFLSKLFFGGEELSEHLIPIGEIETMDQEIVVSLYQKEEDLLEVLRIFDINELRVKNNLKSIFDDNIDQAIEELIISKTFWLGTDSFGRDVLSRLMAGALVSITVGFISVLISLLLGITLGALAGYFGGWLDEVIMWLINVIWSIPTLLLVIAITLAFGKGFVIVFVAVGLTMWVEVARVVRGQVMSVREQEFVQAGKSLGYRSSRIIFRHVILNIMSPVIVISAANFASAILIEAGLSFLGIGAQIPMPSWGSMIKNHYAFITTDMAHLAIFPGLCIMFLVLAFMLVGSGLRDALDVKN